MSIEVQRALIAAAVRTMIGPFAQLERELAAQLGGEIEAELVTEVRAAVELGLAAGSYDVELAARLVTALCDALEEIDPDVFAGLETDDD